VALALIAQRERIRPLMTVEANTFLCTMIVGIGATFALDLWTAFLRIAFKVPSANYCLVGRWLRSMPEGTFTHRSIAAAPARGFECALGWIAHYAIGAGFTLALVLASPGWLAQPTILPALLVGLMTVAMPFLVMQPAFGLGVAASKTPNPTQARLRSLATHVAFGFCLYVSAQVLKLLIDARG